MKIYKSKPLTTTWLGRKGTQYVFRKGSKSTTQRIVFHKWHDTGEFRWRRIEGDGRTPDFIEYESGEWTGGEDQTAMRKFAELQLTKAILV